tara:strand:+ start:323 stop:454 length:132 start_codon:yes stop_codon:yes gene_type:complete
MDKITIPIKQGTRKTSPRALDLISWEKYSIRPVIPTAKINENI